MRILKQIIEKKINNYHFLIKCSQNDLAYQEFITAYLLSLSYLGLSDNKIKNKSLLWMSYVKYGNKSTFSHLKSNMSKEYSIIIEAIKQMDLANEESAQKIGSLYSDFAWAVLSFVHEEQE